MALLLDALKGKNRSRPPIWLMRQAGRYMPEYRAIRSRHSFLDMCFTPELIAEVTQLPIHAFGMDGAILFSDILVILKTLGIPIRFDDGIGPVIEPPIRTDQEIHNLQIADVRDVLSPIAEGIRLLKSQLKIPLIGFCGAPFTVASYALEGKTSRDWRLTKQWLFRRPDALHQLLDKITTASLDYLRMQVEAGVDAIQIFDSWAHVLACDQFAEVSARYLKRLVDGMRDLQVPVILFCRGTLGYIPQLAALHPHAISLDWNCSIADVRRQVPASIALQGNLDPHVLYGHPSVIERETQQILKAMKGDPAFVFNLGHGILPDMTPEAVKTLVECVKG